MKSIKYNKLVRDKIPQIIEQSGKKAIVETLDDDDYIKHLNFKLREELGEYEDSGNVEELADILEVIYAVLELKGLSLNDFERIRLDKVNKRGAFKDRILLKEVIEE